jgi:hypothetical protein
MEEDRELIKARFQYLIRDMLKGLSELQGKVLELAENQEKIGMYEIKTNEEIVKALNKEIEDKGVKNK